MADYLQKLTNELLESKDDPVQEELRETKKKIRTSRKKKKNFNR